MPLAALLNNQLHLLRKQTGARWRGWWVFIDLGSLLHTCLILEMEGMDLWRLRRETLGQMWLPSSMLSTTLKMWIVYELWSSPWSIKQPHYWTYVHFSYFYTCCQWDGKAWVKMNCSLSCGMNILRITFNSVHFDLLKHANNVLLVSKMYLISHIC